MAEVIDRDLRRRWDALIAAREKQVEGSDRELEAVEAELYAHVREGYHWPRSQQDPRQLLPWRDTAWRVELPALEPVQAGGGDIWELRKAENKDLHTLAIERELAADRAQLEALKASERSRGLEVLEPAAAERELEEMEAELQSDLAALKRAQEGADELWLTAAQDSVAPDPSQEKDAAQDPVALDASQERVEEVWQGVDMLPQEASEVLPERESWETSEAKSRPGTAKEPTEARAASAAQPSLGDEASVAEDEYRSAPGVRPVYSVPMWARRGPPSPERARPAASLRLSVAARA